MSIMDSLYAPFKIKSEHLTSKYIKRWRWMTLLAWPFIPASILMALPETPFYDIVFWGWMISSLFVVVICFNPLINTFTRTNKSLDEWEVGHKLASESFTYRLVICILFGLLLGLAAAEFMAEGHWHLAIDISNAVYGVIAILFFALIGQSTYLAWTLDPLGDDEADEAGTVRPVKISGNVMMFAAVIFILGSAFLTLQMADRAYDSQMADYAATKCGKENVKSISTRGYLKIDVTCSESIASED